MYFLQRSSWIEPASCGGTGPAGHRVVPALNGIVLRRSRQPERVGRKVHRDPCGNIGRGEVFARDIGGLLQPLVEIEKEVLDPPYATLEQGRNLIVVVRARDRTTL